MPGAQTTTACPSTSMPRRPARPVSCVYSPGVTSTCASPFHLTSRSRTTVRAGMLMPRASVSVAKTAFTRPRTKHSSTVSLNAGTRPAWWAASPASRPSRHSQKPRTCRSSSGSEPVRRSMISAISARSDSSVSRSPESRHWWTAASQPLRLKTKVIAGSRPALSSRSTTSYRDGGRYRGRSEESRRRSPPPPQVSIRRSCSRTKRTSSGSTTEAPRSRVDCPRGVSPCSARVRRGPQGEQVEDPAADQHVLPQRHRPDLADHDPRVAADGHQPLAELLGVADRRRQRDEGDPLREVDDHLLPHRAAEPVGEVVHLVHDHVAEPVDGRRLGVEHVAQHLGGHHDHGGVAVDGVVAGQQPDLLLAVALDQVVVLLVATAP